MNKKGIVAILKNNAPEFLKWLCAEADRIRKINIGDEVHLRALVEISNYCRRECLYCGLNKNNRSLERFRMNSDEVVAAALKAEKMGFGTIVIQSGEDPGLTSDFISELVKTISSSTSLAITLSLGERNQDEYKEWKEAGADRYLLKFETSDDELYNRIHPPIKEVKKTRIEILKELKDMGYEAGNGVMVGLPGQTLESLADDLLIFQELDLDMVASGPYIPHPETELGKLKNSGYDIKYIESLTIKMIALARILCPKANIPATTALTVMDPEKGRMLALQAGANVIMPDFTPEPYKQMYEIYAGKTDSPLWDDEHQRGLLKFLASIGRKPSKGKGGRVR
jgi:biotin synthase